MQATGSSHQLLCCLQEAHLLAFSPPVTNVNATEYRPVRGEGLYSAAGLRFGALKKSKSLKQEHDPFNSFHQEFFLLAVYVATALLCARCAHRRPGRMDPRPPPDRWDSCTV